MIRSATAANQPATVRRPVWQYGTGLDANSASARRTTSAERASRRRPAASAVGATPPSSSAPSTERSARGPAGADARHAAGADAPADAIDLHDDVVVGAVGAGTEAPGTSRTLHHSPSLSVGGAHDPLVGEEVRQGVVERPRATDGADEVGRQHRVPQRGVGCGGDRRHRLDEQLCAGWPAFHRFSIFQAGEAVGVQGVDDVRVRSIDARNQFSPPSTSPARSPVAAPDGAISSSDSVGSTSRTCLAAAGLLGERGAAPVDRHHAPPCRDAVAEALVDPAFAGRQRGERLGAVVDVVVDRLHQRLSTP